MARTLRDPRLDSRTSRRTLPQAHQPYWKSIDSGMHLGYRKGKLKSSWIARYRSEDGRYHKTVLAIADDTQDPDGLNILSFSQAQSKAREWFAKMAFQEAGYSSVHKGRFTVAQVMENYLDWSIVHRRSIDQLRSVCNAHILPILGHLEADKLTHVKIRSFHEKIALSAPQRRSRPGGKKNFDIKEMSLEDLRRRKATANRVLTVLKAALNRSYVEGLIASDEPWRRVVPFRSVDAARVRYLTLPECAKLVESCDQDFGVLVKAALFTGCRYGELTKLRVCDFLKEQGRLYVQSSKNGKERFVILSDEAQLFFAEIVSDHPLDKIMFCHFDGSVWGRAHQTRRLGQACKIAGIEPEISFHILRHTHASLLAMNRTPMPVIAAQLGHSDTRMVEKHYAHLAPSYVADAIRDGMPKFNV